MKNKTLKIPAIIIAIGFVLAVVVHLLTSIKMMPTVTEQDFEYSVTYKLGGETKTISGVYSCRFDGFGNGSIDPLDRYYTGEFTVNGVTTLNRGHTVATADGFTLEIITLFNDGYLMGDYEASHEAPWFEAIDEEGIQYEGEDIPDVFDAEIISWEYPTPIENSFKFAGFAGLHTVGLGAILLVVILTLIACMIFVKKDAEVVYSRFDKFGILLNFIFAIVVLPVIYFIVNIVQAFQSGADWIYQAYLCIPPLLVFTLAASVSLRRKGFRKIGFFIQFLAPIALYLLGVLEYIL